MTDLEQEITYLQELRAKYRENIRKLKKQLAIYAAGEAPVHLLNKLESEQEQLRQVEEQLAKLEAQEESPERIQRKRQRERAPVPAWVPIAGGIVMLVACAACTGLSVLLIPNARDAFVAWLPKTPTMTPTSSPTHTPIISTATPTKTPFTPTATSTFTPTPTSTPTPTPTDTPPPVPTGMVYIPAGEFLMGSDLERDEHAKDNELPQHWVYLDAFFIDRTEVTNKKFREFTLERDYKSEPGGKGSIWEQGSELVPTEGVSWSQPQDPYDDWLKWLSHPVVQVSWHDARAYCQWLGEKTGEEYRLPTEAEWEKAAGWDHEQERKQVWPWGDDSPTGKKLFNYCDVGCKIAPDVTWADTEFNDGFKRTAPVGSFSPQGDSPYGVQDMAGNVWEWCSSLFQNYPYDPDDGRENLEAEGPRVLRGGSWFQGYGEWGRTASRFSATPEARTFDIGFRCVRSVKDSQNEE